MSSSGGESDVISELSAGRPIGNDDTPLVALVRDQPYSRGGLTSQGRTNSESYAAFVRRARKEFSPHAKRD